MGRKNNTNYAKIAPPNYPEIVSRPRLLQQLSAEQGARAAWLTGGPGSGKTTLAADRLRDRDITGLWYHVDPSDRDLGSFFHYIALAARRALPRKRLALPALTAEYDLGTEIFAHEFFRTLFSRIPRPFVLVLDDFHALPRSGLLERITAIAIEELPDHGFIVITSREDIPGELTRLLAARHIRRLGGDALLFTPAETRELLAALGSGADPDRLQRTTRGWAAGLVMMATLGEDERGGQQSPELMFEYFGHEVLEQLSPASRRLLAAASALPEMPWPFIEALAEDQESTRTFEDLVRRGFFVYRHNRSARIYAFHPLFRDYLASRTGELLPDKVLDLLRRRAARAIEDSYPEEAASLFIMVNDWDGLERVVESTARQLIAQGREHTVDDWISAVPDPERQRRPWLTYWKGLCKLHLDPTGALRLLESAFDTFEHLDDARGVWLSWAGAIEARFMAQHAIGELEQWTAMYPALQSRFPISDRRIKARMALGMSIGLVYGATGHPDAAYWSREASRRAILSLDPETGLKAYQLRIALCCWQGRFDEAGRLVRHLRRLERATNPPPVVRLMVDIADALLAAYQLDFERALRITSQASEVAERHGVHVLDGHIVGIGANAAVEAGEQTTAELMLEQLCPVAETERHNEAAYYFNIAALHALASGYTSRALDLINEGRSRIAVSGMPLRRFTVQATYARVLQSSEQIPAALEAARGALETARALNSPYCMLGAELILADILYEQEDPEAHQVLAHAMDEGRRNGLKGSIFASRECHKRTCIRALSSGVETDYVRTMIRHLALDSWNVPRRIAQWPWPVRLFTLGRLDVHREGKRAVGRSKPPRRALEMLSELIIAGAAGIGTDDLADALWPDSDGDAARRSLDTTIHRLRRVLGPDAAVAVSGGRVSLNPTIVWTDLEAFEEVLADTPSDTGTPVSDADRLLAAYPGPLLPGYRRAQPRRLALESRFARAIDQECQRIAESDNRMEAVRICESALERAPGAEALYRSLMLLTAQEGENSVRTAFERCREAVRSVHGVGPGLETRRLAESLLSQPATGTGV